MRMKKCLWAAILCAVMLFCLLPAAALAQSSTSIVVVGGVTMSGEGYWKTTNGALVPYTEGGEAWNVKYDGSGTLTLKDATINGSGTETVNGAAIYSTRNLTLFLQGESTVTSKMEDAQTIGVYVNGSDLTVTGGGTLNANGATTDKPYGSSIGMSAENGNILITGSASVNAEGNSARPSTGIKTLYSGNITISTTGTVTATSTTYYGIEAAQAEGTITISSGTVIATGATSAMNKAPVISNTKARCIASTDTSGTPPTAYIEANIEQYKYLEIVAPQTLPAPTGLAWDSAIPGKATWGTVTGANGYTVQLYKGNETQGNPVSVASGTSTYDFTSTIASAGSGSYTFKVTAKGNNTSHVDSPEAVSAAYSFTAPVVTVSGTSIYANGAALIIRQGTPASTSTVYIDVNGNGSIDSADKSLKNAGVVNAPNDNTNLSGWNVYGGGVTAGTYNTQITMLSGNVGRILGGSNTAAMTGNTNVIMRGGSVYFIWGGSYGASAYGDNVTLKGNTRVEISGGTVNTRVNGGGHYGIVEGSTSVIISNGTVNGNVFGGGAQARATVSVGTNVNITGGTVNGNVYGGGGSLTSTVNGYANVNIGGGTITGSVYGHGANAAQVNGNRTVSVSGAPVIGGTSEGIQLNSITDNSVTITGALTGTDGAIVLMPNETEPNTVVASATTPSHANAAKFTLSGIPAGSSLAANTTDGTVFIAANTHTITATTGANGTITPSGEVEVAEGDSQTFTIAADTGYQIANVKVDNVSVGPVDTYTFENVTANHTLEATFEELPPTIYTITATAGANGTITPSGEVEVAEGDSQTFTIAADTGYQIANVKVDNVSVGPVDTYTFENVTANHTLEATFEELPPTIYTITATAGANGTITPSGEVEVAEGDSQTFTIAADTGYQIADVKINNVSVGPVDTYTFENVTANHTLEATFEEIPVTPTIEFDTHPQDKALVVGSITESDTLTAAASVSPSGDVALDWYACDSTGAITGDSLHTGDTYSILTELEAGTYYYLCQATATSAEAVNSNVATVTVNAPDAAPEIVGDTEMTLDPGYAATSTNAFTITGNPTPTIMKTSGDTSITWNDETKQLEIAEGLTEGEYIVILTAENGVSPDATLTFTLTVTPAPTATISDVTVIGTTGTAIADTDATITLANEKFNALEANENVSTWFANMPAGLAAKIKTAVAADDTTAAVTFTGTPTAESTEAMAVTIPGASLTSGKTLPIASNANAKWDIAAPVSASINPITATFDKHSPADLAFTLDPGTYALRAIMYGETALVEGDDYTVSTDVYTIKQSFLNAQAEGEVRLVFDMDGGSDPMATITITDGTPAQPIVIPFGDPYVLVGKRATFSVNAPDATGYQWEINRNDGRGWQEIPGATEARYTTSAVELKNNGYQYRCRITDMHGNTFHSEIVVLHVLNATTPPKTGDDSRPLLWLSLFVSGALGFMLLNRRRRRV